MFYTYHFAFGDRRGVHVCVCVFTFGLGGHCKEAIVGEQFEHGPDAIRVSAQEHLLVSRVQQHEGKHSIQQRRHLFDAEAIIQVQKDLSVSFSLVLKLKHILQLKTVCGRETDTHRYVFYF